MGSQALLLHFGNSKVTLYRMDASLHGDGTLALELMFNNVEQNSKDYLDTRLDAFRHDLFRALRLKDAGSETG